MDIEHQDYCDCVECVRGRLRRMYTQVESSKDEKPAIRRLPPPNPGIVDKPGRIEKERRGMTWSKEHLNWTLFCGVFFASSIASLGGVIGSLKIFFPLLIGATAVQLYVGIWYLKQKSLSLWFLLLCLIPGIGFIALLLLRNLSYYVELVGKDETLGPFRSKGEILDWYNARRDWEGVRRIKVTDG